jgi:predicted transcriptional regulator
MAIGVTRLRKAAMTDRKEACLKYLQQRSTPITAIELAAKLKMSAHSIHNSLWPLLDEGKIIRKRLKRQSTISKRPGWAYGYTAAEIVLPTRNKKVTWHNPFSL